jgi:hypothetical protein
MFTNRMRIPQPPDPSPSPAGFVLCPRGYFPPLTAEQLAWQNALYEWALAQAQAVVRPSLPERDLLAVWN